MNPSLNALNEAPFFTAQQPLWARVSSLSRLHGHPATHCGGNEAGHSSAAGTPLTGHVLYADNLKVEDEVSRQLNQLMKIVKMFKHTEKWNLVCAVVGVFSVRRENCGTRRVRNKTKGYNRASECNRWLLTPRCTAVQTNLTHRFYEAISNCTEQ